MRDHIDLFLRDEFDESQRSKREEKVTNINLFMSISKSKVKDVHLLQVNAMHTFAIIG